MTSGSSKNARFFIVDTKDVVQEALDIHGCSPTAIKAFGRFLTGAIMMGTTLKGKDLLTLRTNTDGLLKQMLATVDANGNVKGYLSDSEVDLEIKDGVVPKVGDLIGKGKFSETGLIDEKIDNLLKTEMNKITTPVSAFITFTTQEGFERCNNQMNKYNEKGELNRERLPYKFLTEEPFVRDAPDPSNIIWENQGITRKRKLCNNMLAYLQ